jgi:ligand-binding SRPBCC domain-containing protein
MPVPRTVTRSSLLNAPCEQVWSRVTTAAGVNDELAPWLRMTWPADGGSLADLRDDQLGTRLFRAWILLFAVLPIDYDDLTLATLDRGRGFVEESTMLTQRRWRHERTLTPSDDGSRCALVDRVTFEPRVGAIVGITESVVTAVFAHRHARLRRRFGDAEALSAAKTSLD